MLVSKFMTSQPGTQTIKIQILTNIWRSKGNQAIKFGKLIDIRWEIFFFKYHPKNEAGRLVPDFFLFFKKALYKMKASGLHLDFKIFSIAHD